MTNINVIGKGKGKVKGKKDMKKTPTKKRSKTDKICREQAVDNI